VPAVGRLLRDVGSFGSAPGQEPGEPPPLGFGGISPVFVWVECRWGRNLPWVAIFDDGLRAAGYEQLRFVGTDIGFGRRASLRQEWGAALRIVGTRRQDMDEPIAEESLCPVLRVGAETTRYRPGRELNPGADLGGVDELAVMPIVEPGEPFGVGDDRPVTGSQQVENQTREADGNRMVVGSNRKYRVP